MKLGPALVMTPDLDAALAFYGEVLGLPLRERAEDQLVFDVGASSLHVFRCQKQRTEIQHGEDAASVVTFEVQCLDAEMARLRARGVTFLHESPGRNALAGLSYAAFLAPGGNVHELVERVRS
ncbi:VOC family protein [Phenylobacterium sp.]|uniref:VOC family protein n=1 Tax=Phenylobacterium sp. TaxID=1871053 RepID=UPI0027304DF7|nr:VOC family protein [Phenylobacterium sp.]MDP1874887.1 VOC family protein [Phenylobacterium sp.]MDP3300133.1 VOC family protein [Phenylobacterium sp.]